MPHKQCSHCLENLPLENFGKNRSRKDGLQAWCKQCQNNYVKANRSPTTAKELKDQVKLVKYGEALLRHNGVGYKAYREVSNCSSDASAMAANTSFLRNLKTTKDLIEELKKPELLLAYNKYVVDALSVGTLTEKRDAVKLVFQVIGLLGERQEPVHTVTTAEERDAKILRVMQVMKSRMIEEKT